MFEGILIGVVASSVFAFLTVMTKQWLLPKYLEITYVGSKVAGVWECYFEGSEEIGAEIEFFQRGRMISGKSRVTRNRKGEVIDRRYSYSGRFLNRSITLIFEDLNNPTMYGGSMVFHTFNSDGTGMKGISMFYKPEVNDVVTVQAELWKKGSKPKIS